MLNLVPRLRGLRCRRGFIIWEGGGCLARLRPLQFKYYYLSIKSIVSNQI